MLAAAPERLFPRGSRRVYYRLTNRLTVKAVTVETVKVSSKGQIVIPKQLREAHRIAPGMEFVVSTVGDEIRLRPAPLFAPSTHEQAAGCLRRKARKPATDAGMNAAVRERAQRLDDATKTG